MSTVALDLVHQFPIGWTRARGRAPDPVPLRGRQVRVHARAVVGQQRFPI
jgi:hypothetical protein